MSDGPPMGNRRITLPYFRTCSTCLSPSQARFCHCTLRTVAIRPERTLGSLRYSFGGDHPSQTTHQAVSAYHALDLRQPKGRISRMAPRKLALPLQSLRPILHIG